MKKQARYRWPVPAALLLIGCLVAASVDWGAATPALPGGVNAPRVESRSGTYLYFSTDKHTGNQDIYVSQMRNDGTYGPGKRLGYPINTEYNDQYPNVSQDGREIVFASDRPSSPDDASGFDIFYAKRQSRSKSWRRVRNISETISLDTASSSCCIN